MIPQYRVTFHNKPGECKSPVLAWSATGTLMGIEKQTVDDPLILVVRVEDFIAPCGYVDFLMSVNEVSSVVPIKETP